EYNSERPHSSLGYLTPQQFAQTFVDPTPINSTA
ncbi:integrase core domain-containing protein, partial [Enterococcus faecalis]